MLHLEVPLRFHIFSEESRAKPARGPADPVPSQWGRSGQRVVAFCYRIELDLLLFHVRDFTQV